jgi:HJR/Mrr/RecB family endonuclease
MPKTKKQAAAKQRHLFTVELDHREHVALMAIRSALGTRTKVDTVRRLILDADRELKDRAGRAAS